MAKLIEKFKQRKFLSLEIIILILLIPLTVRLATDPQTKSMFSRAAAEKTTQLWLEPQEIKTTPNQEISFRLMAAVPSENVSSEITIVLLHEKNKLAFIPQSLESKVLKIKNLQVLPGKISFKLEGIFSGQSTVARFSFKTLSLGKTSLKFDPETKIVDVTGKNIINETAYSQILIY